MHVHLHAQPGKEFKGKITDEAGAPLSLATIKVQTQDIIYYAGKDGSFTITLPAGATELTLVISHIGKETITRTFTGEALTQLQVIRMQSLSLKLPEVEVNGVRRKTSASNSSIVFDREAIEQTQALSVANVLNYLPGQTIMKPTITVQSVASLLMRTAVPMNSEQALNQAFGISFQVDGAAISNNANMQTLNPLRIGYFTANQISHPENSFIRDRAYRNGTLYNSYTGDAANNGLDMRQIPAENIESIEVVSGVASARYGDYTNGLVLIERQAGITPLRVNLRTNEGTLNAGINKGFRLSPAWGIVNLSLDYLNSNDDPRNKLKAFQRVGGSLLWTYKQDNAFRFRNTLSLDINTTLDRTRRDPDEGKERMAKFNSRTVRISNRSEWLVKQPWLYSVSLQGSYSYGRQESYDQYYRNGAVLSYSDAMTTGINEGYYGPGNYLAVQQVIGEPVNASARIETRSLFKWANNSYQVVLGVNYSYSANKGPGVIIDASRPRLTSEKSDRPRSFDQVPSQSNAGVYIENNLSTRLLGRVFTVNAGVRGDMQNSYFTVSPRINSNWKLSKNITWNIAYGIATKAPALSQISPGNLYIDIPLVNAYNGYAAQSVYLVHTQVINMNNIDLRPYRSFTFETGFSMDAKPLRVSALVFSRTNKEGFASTTQALPITLPVYDVTPQPGQKPLYAPNGTFKTWHLTYNKFTNSDYSRNKGVELMIATDKIRALQTSFSMSTAFYHSEAMNSAAQISLGGNGQQMIDTSKTAWYGIYKDQAQRSTTIKSTFVTNTHIPALRMAVMFSGELFWMSRTRYLYSSMYPVGYLDRNGNYFPLTPEQAMSPEYNHLQKKAASEAVSYLPAFVYPNVSMRLSKEIGDILRFSFNAYNVFNIRPQQKTETGTNYYNGQPSFGAELIFTIK
jgi:ferric enterobactin receptor